MVQHLLAWWRREWMFLLLASVLTLSLRLSYNALFIGPGYVPERDAREYSDIALKLAQGQGFRLANGQITAIRAPIFPLLLAGVYLLHGEDHGLALFLQALIGAALVPAIYLAGKRAFDTRAGRVAGLIAATYPLLAWAGGGLLSEPLFILLVTLAMAAALGAVGENRLRHYAWLGGLLGLAWLTRPNGLWLLPFLLGWLLLVGAGTFKARARGVLLACLAAVAVASPWIVRNALVFDKFIPTTTGGGYVALGAYNEKVLTEPQLQGSWVNPCLVRELDWTCVLPEVPRDAAQLRATGDFIRGHLTDLPKMFWWRFVRFWHLYRFTHGFPETIGFYYYVVVTALAMAGLWITRARWRSTGVLLATVACVMGTGLLLWADVRMRLPGEPALILLAAGLATCCWDYVCFTASRWIPKPGR
jgi:4-amino-4-deoxy-L-arabinose transferase-like glycosyltransferase